MFAEIKDNSINRQLHTSEPRFKRLVRVQTSEYLDLNQKTLSNFPTVTRGNAFDNSKENLCYENYLSKVKSACKIDQSTIVSKYLNSIRKDYDQMNKESRRELMTMKIKKRQIQFIKEKNQVHQERREELEKKIKEKDAETAQIKEKYQNFKMQTKTLENIITRMKKDQIFYKQFGRVKDEQLKDIIKLVKSNDETIIHEEENIYKLLNSLSNCKQLLNKNMEVREKKLDDFYGKIQDVRERDKFLQERKERTYELQSIEMNDTKDQKNIHMRQIILVHKVADSLLESKVNTLIKDYADLQNAFHLVKNKTCVTDPQLLVSKFFSYQESAQNLLQSIDKYEKKVDELAKRKKYLEGSFKNLLTANLEENSSKNHILNTFINKKEILNAEYNQNKLLIEQITSLIDKKIALVNPIQELNYKNMKIDEKLSQLCRFTLKTAKEYKNIDLFDIKYQTGGIRIKKTQKQLSNEELCLKMKQSEEMTQNNFIENQFLKTSRQSAAVNKFSIKRRSMVKH